MPATTPDQNSELPGRLSSSSPCSVTTVWTTLALGELFSSMSRRSCSATSDCSSMRRSSEEASARRRHMVPDKIAGCGGRQAVIRNGLPRPADGAGGSLVRQPEQPPRVAAEDEGAIFLG